MKSLTARGRDRALLVAAAVAKAGSGGQSFSWRDVARCMSEPDSVRVLRLVLRMARNGDLISAGYRQVGDGRGYPSQESVYTLAR